MSAIFISLVALGFAIFSFWWMNWRSGDLLVGAPRTYAAACSNGNVIVYLPLVFYNSGAKPILIENLQLKFVGEKIAPLFFNATIEKLGTDEGRAFATQFPIEGNTTIRIICEFQIKDSDFGFYENEFQMVLEARLNENDWRQVKGFKLRVNEAAAVALATGRIHVRDNHN